MVEAHYQLAVLLMQGLHLGLMGAVAVSLFKLTRRLGYLRGPRGHRGPAGATGPQGLSAGTSTPARKP